jgi:hypothetical protein
MSLRTNVVHSIWKTGLYIQMRAIASCVVQCYSQRVCTPAVRRIVIQSQDDVRGLLFRATSIGECRGLILIDHRAVVSPCRRTRLSDGRSAVAAVCRPPEEVGSTGRESVQHARPGIARQLTTNVTGQVAGERLNRTQASFLSCNFCYVRRISVLSPRATQLRDNRSRGLNKKRDSATNRFRFKISRN